MTLKAAYQCSFYLYHSNNASDSETYGSLAVLGSQGTPRRPIVITKHVKDLPHVPPGLGELYREVREFSFFSPGDLCVRIQDARIYDDKGKIIE